MSARDRILARLRAAPVLPVAPPSLPEMTLATPSPDPWSQCIAHLAAAHAHVIRTTESAWRDELKFCCRERNIRTLLLPMSGIELSAWTDGPELRRFNNPIETHKDALFGDTDAGITWADCAIAETGTLVIKAAPHAPRSLSLVPPIHFCLVDARRLYPTLPAAMQAERWTDAMPSNLIFVSGPSKTADIQQTLAYGAHGPKEMIVFVINSGDAA